ncbi:MAG: GNAT family N-acetyltransferase [Bacteroidota bacterium]
MEPYEIVKGGGTEDIVALRAECLASLTSPPDGMWQAFRAAAVVWTVRHQKKTIGYALVDEAQQLLQFYIQPLHLPDRLIIFSHLLEEAEVKAGIVGTHQPVFYSTALHFVQHLQVHTYLFRERLPKTVIPKAGKLKEVAKDELAQMVAFCHYSVGAPESWLQSYLGDLIGKRELFCLRLDGKIAGTCEVRKSEAAPDFADIGMIISPDFRRQGYGTYLLSSAKGIALQQGLQPICSCEKGNVGSLRAIETNGFRTTHSLLAVNFTTQIK